MGLTFHAEGRVGAPATHVGPWRSAAEASPTPEAFAETYLGHTDAEITARVQAGRLIVETKPDVKNAVGADGREPRHAYFRLDIELKSDVLTDLAAILVDRVNNARRLLAA